MAAVESLEPGLPPLPPSRAALDEAQIRQLEVEVTHRLAQLSDITSLLAWRDQLRALAAPLRGQPVYRPILGAQRRIEARVGQLLGDAPVSRSPSVVNGVAGYDRQRFRVLARGLEKGLTDEEWRSNREPLLQLIQKKYPKPAGARTAGYTQGDGIVRKPKALRAEEIREMVAKGALAGGIAERLGIGVIQVRKIARQAGIRLHDEALGPQRAVDPHRVVEKIVYGLEGTQMSLRLIGSNFTGITREEATYWVESLSESITSLKRLRNALWRMSK